MRTLSTNLSTLLSGTNVYTAADLVEIVQADGAVYRWTTANARVTYGGNIYLADGPLVNRGKSRSTAGFSSDGIDVALDGAATVTGGKKLALAGVDGELDGATVTITHVYFDAAGALVDGVVYFTGKVEYPEPRSAQTILKVKSLLAALASTPFPRGVIRPPCVWELYGPGCVAPASRAAVIAAHTASRTILATSTATVLKYATSCTTAAPGWAAFTSGANAGLSRPIASNDGGTQVTVALPFPYTPAVGDAFGIVEGCDRSRETCLAVFDNLTRIRAFPDVPNPDVGDLSAPSSGPSYQGPGYGGSPGTARRAV